MPQLAEREQVIEYMQASEDALFNDHAKYGIYERCLADGSLRSDGAMAVFCPELNDLDRDQVILAKTSLVLDVVDKRYGYIKGKNNGRLIGDYIQALRLGYVPERGEEWTFQRQDKKIMSLSVYVPHHARRNDEIGLWVGTIPPMNMLEILRSLQEDKFNG